METLPPFEPEKTATLTKDHRVSFNAIAEELGILDSTDDDPENPDILRAKYLAARRFNNELLACIDELDLPGNPLDELIERMGGNCSLLIS